MTTPPTQRDVVRRECHCGHHQDTHYEGSGACLGMRCDDCTQYRDRSRPDPRRPGAR